ncbi:MAG: NAD-dependent epimerase/dehydratase family protein [Pontixanthobacter sp.]
MTLAITGGTGFVGQAVLDLLRQRSMAARALARTVPSDRPEVDWVAGSLADTAALDQLVDGASAILHIAGLTNAPDPAHFAAANVGGTAAMIAAARKAGIDRFVFVSSLAAREPSLSAYGASKAAAEALVAQSGLDWTIVRPPAVYGPRDTDMLELFRAARFGIVPLPPGGATSLIHAEDLARLLCDLPAAGREAWAKTFEPDDGRTGGWSHKEMARAIGMAMGRRVWAPHCPATLLSLAARGDRIIRGDKAKLTPDRVGYMCHPNWVSHSNRRVPPEVWAPDIETREGLRSTARWYREHSWL